MTYSGNASLPAIASTAAARSSCPQSSNDILKSLSEGGRDWPIPR